MARKNKPPHSLEVQSIVKLCEEQLVDMKRIIRKHMALHWSNTDKKIRKFVKEISDTLEEMDKKILSYADTVRDIQKIAIQSEETLCNVLLAIRQNEYLQAWYPAQHGFKEMKVTGTHPAKLIKE